jgi:hypothetical protein
MSNYGLFIVWPNYFSSAEEIIKDLNIKFNIVEVYEIEWDKKTFFTNIYRFYGDRLSTSSIKEKADNKFTLKVIIVEDLNPVFEFRLNARGVEKVNSNFFDKKKKLRNKYNTRFGIHATNDEIETNRDLCLLLGINLKDYKNKEKSSDLIKSNRNITGHDNWKSFEELFYFLNAVEPYVILRNVEDIGMEMSEDDDIDFLVYDHVRMSYFLNARKMSKGTQRVNYQIIINNKSFRIDLRYIGDNYFDIFWQNNCMKNRILDKNNIYVLDDDNAYYSLIYHSLIHKRKVPTKYLEKLNLSVEEFKNILYEYMYDNSYKMVEPLDITLYFNKKYGGDIKFSKDRRIRNKKGLIGNIKKIFYKINNLIHLTKGPA